MSIIGVRLGDIDVSVEFTDKSDDVSPVEIILKADREEETEHVAIDLFTARELHASLSRMFELYDTRNMKITTE